MRFILMLFVVFSISVSMASAKNQVYPLDNYLAALTDSIPQTRKKPLRFRPSPIIGTSITYIPGEHFSNQFGWLTEHEFTWSLNMAFPLSPRWELGFDYKSIMSFVDREDKTFNWMAGAFTHFNFFSDDIGKLFAEGGLYMGDICFCRPEYYTLENQFYLALGLGGEVLLNKNFSVDLGMTGYATIVGELESSAGTMLYVFGINYQF